METIVGTAGHIDHGKTALVKALTGVDTDRLPEEKRRGITVDLGFAEMSIGDVHFGFVDVPGHEKFVRNMLAGASGIDVVLLVVAADEGVMPQTREHFDICRLLDIKTGVIALTKSDLVDAETLELARFDIAELVAGSFLEHSAVVPVSSKTGHGIADLKASLRMAASSTPMRPDNRVARLPIDRSFSVKGFGTVVTGTLVSGRIDHNTRLEVLPERRAVRVRGLQTHGAAAVAVQAGQRVAVNIANVDHTELHRGMMLAEAGVLEPTQTFDAEAEVLANAAKPLKSRARVRIHLGTSELIARIHVLNDRGEIAAGARDLVQVRLELPTSTLPGERFIIRSYSPQHTIGGGVVIDNSAERHRKREFPKVRARLSAGLELLQDPLRMLFLLIKSSGAAGIGMDELRSRTGYADLILRNTLAALGDRVIAAGNRYVDASEFNGSRSIALDALKKAHIADPLSKGLRREALSDAAFSFMPGEIVAAVIESLENEGHIVVEGDVIRIGSHGSTLGREEKLFSERLLSIYRDAKFDVPKSNEAIAEAGEGLSITSQTAVKLVRLLLDSNDIVKVTDEFYFDAHAVSDLVVKLKTLPDVEIDVPKFKEIAGVSRKYAIPLLEYLDRMKVTARVGDKRVVLK